MPKAPALPNRCLVEYGSHPADESVIVARLRDLYPALRCLTDKVPSACADLLVPPMIKVADGKSGKRLPFLVEIEARLDLGQALPEGKYVDLQRRMRQGGNYGLGVLDIVVPLIFQPSNCCGATRKGESLVADLEAFYARRLSLDEGSFREATNHACLAYGREPFGDDRRHSSKSARLKRSL